MPNTKRSTRHKFYLYVGDWGEDGHEVSLRYMFKANHTLDEILEAYHRSCAKVGYQFHSINPNGDSTGRVNFPPDFKRWNHYSWNEHLGVFTSYQESFLRDEPAQAFQEHGLEIKKNYQVKPYTPIEVAKLFLNFIGLSLKDFKWKRIKAESKRVPYYRTSKEKIPYLNFQRKFHCYLGYGVMNLVKEETTLLNMQAQLRDLYKKNKTRQLESLFEKYMELEAAFPKYLCSPPNFYILNKMYGIPERAFHGIYWNLKQRQNSNL